MTDCAWGGKLLGSMDPGAESSQSGPKEEDEWSIVILTVILKQSRSLVQSGAVDVYAWVTAQPGCQCFFIDSVVEEYFSC